jgi:hypothetical protein
MTSTLMGSPMTCRQPLSDQEGKLWHLESCWWLNTKGRNCDAPMGRHPRRIFRGLCRMGVIGQSLPRGLTVNSGRQPDCTTHAEIPPAKSAWNKSCLKCRPGWSQRRIETRKGSVIGKSKASLRWRSNVVRFPANFPAITVTNIHIRPVTL